MLCFWYELVVPHTHNKLSSLVYSMLYKMHIHGPTKNKYLDYIKSMLIDIGLPYLWNDHSRLNFTLSVFKSLVKKQLQGLFVQD